MRFAVLAMAFVVALPHAPARAAGVELNAADAALYKEATNLIQTWPGHGDQMERAVKILAGIAERNPGSAYPLAAYAELKYRMMGDSQGAAGEVLAIADRAVKLDPDNADAQVVYSKIMLEQGHVDVAARAAQRAIRLAPDKPEAMFQMASIARRAKRYDEAETWYRKSIERLADKQRKSNVYFHLGQMLDERKPLDVEKAAAAFEQAADLTDDSIPILNDSAVFLMHNTERYDRAIGFIRKAQRISDYPLGRQNLGLLQYYKWGHATLHPENYRNAAEKPWEPARITAETGVSKEFAFAHNPIVNVRPHATLAMLQLGMIKDIDVFPENCDCPDNALTAAARSNHADVVRLLVGKGANVNVVDRRYGSTALLYAVRSQNADLVAFLLERGARVNVQDKRGTLLVEYAIIDARPDDARILRMLLEKGGDAEAVTARGAPLSAVAVLQGKPAALALLLRQYKADPNARTGGERGDPLLVRAALNTHADGSEMVRLLLDAGANPWVKVRGQDVVAMLASSKEAFAVSSDLPPEIRKGNEGILRAADANIAMLEGARRKTSRPAGF